jgi:MmyB-like transcription regulator ligand binding domain
MSGAALRLGTQHRHLERSAVGGSVRDRLVGAVEVEFRDREIVELEQARSNEANKAMGRLRRVHPHAVDGDAVPHDPGIRQIQSGAAEHADTPHQDWNAAADAIFAFSRLPEADRNILVCVLTNPATRRLFGASWADEARRMVAQFRATHDLWAGDPAFRDLLARLQQGCPEFSGWWEAHDVRGIAAGRKSLSHPSKGRLKLDYASFQANDDPALKLVIYTVS